MRDAEKDQKNFQYLSSSTAKEANLLQSGLGLYLYYLLHQAAIA